MSITKVNSKTSRLPFTFVTNNRTHCQNKKQEIESVKLPPYRNGNTVLLGLQYCLKAVYFFNKTFYFRLLYLSV